MENYRTVLSKTAIIKDSDLSRHQQLSGACKYKATNNIWLLQATQAKHTRDSQEKHQTPMCLLKGSGSKKLLRTHGNILSILDLI
jgi:hypothetical protein